MEQDELEAAVLSDERLRQTLEAAAPGMPRPPLVSRGDFTKYAGDDRTAATNRDADG